MIIADNLWREFKRLKQELLDLKQVKKASCASKYFTKEITQPQSFIIKITYKSGSQPIITEALTDAAVAFSNPVGNVQYMSTFSQYASDIILFSTREIESIVEV